MGFLGSRVWLCEIWNPQLRTRMGNRQVQSRPWRFDQGNYPTEAQCKVMEYYNLTKGVGELSITWDKKKLIDRGWTNDKDAQPI